MQITTLQAFARRQEGQTMSEYTVVLATITLAVVATIELLSNAIVSEFSGVVTTIKELVG
jgi:Flp pilus assembly pilin Flp